MAQVTLCVTSCGRHDLLERTLRSFVRFNTHPIVRTVICEDSDLPAPAWLEQLTDLGEKVWIANGKRKGQIYTCDRAMAEVDTPYVFWSEDDWEYIQAGFTEKSLAILEKYSNILQCSIREDWEHPSVNLPAFPFPINQPDWHGGWSGFSFNPGLRRLKDYQHIGSYGREVGYDPAFVGELHLSKLYRAMGFYAAALPAHCKHIGEGNRHVAWETAPKAPKVLIAIPMCHRYDYGTHKDPNIDHSNKVSSARMDAVRSTWAKYLPAFQSYVDLKFFYGGCTEDCQHQADEVSLNVADDYDSLPHKVKAIYQYALDHKYDFVFKGDDDCFVYLDRLMASGFEDHDYVGYTTADPTHPLKERYASGGSGYWVSRKAMQVLVKSDVGKYWAEDWWVGNTLQKNDIPVTRDARYLPGFERHYVNLERLPEPHNYISFHACSPDMMQRLYQANPAPTFQLVTHALGEGESFTGMCQSNLKLKEKFLIVPDIKRMKNGKRVLIAIVSCHKRAPFRKAQRETWIRDVRKSTADYKFFLGRSWDDPRRPQANGILPEFDEVFLDVPDSYESLPEKTEALIAWAYAQGFDYLFKCDEDSFVKIDRLLASGFTRHHYVGYAKQPQHGTKDVWYAQGGAGYSLDRHAMKIILAHPDKLLQGAEDMNVARILKANGIEVFNDARYQPTKDVMPSPANDIITCHRMQPEDMRSLYQEFSSKPSPACSEELGQEPEGAEMEREQVCQPQA